MPRKSAPGGPRVRPLVELLIVSAGMAAFALFAHQGGPWVAFSAAALLGVAATVGISLSTAPGGAQLLGIARSPRGPVLMAVSMVLAGGFGAGAGLWHRHGLGLPAWPPGGWARFAPVAALVGAAEELLFRGWLQGRARLLGMPVAVVLAAVAHAVYKTLLFAWPATPIAIDYPQLALVTLCGGLVLGLLRELARSVWPAVIAHAAFDVVVYGPLAVAPWWVWR